MMTRTLRALILPRSCPMGAWWWRTLTSPMPTWPSS